MNEQEKRELMLRFAAENGGEWPNEFCDTACVTRDGDFFVARKDQYQHVSEFFGTKQEYLDLVQSLFEGAPDDAEYWRRNGFYKRGDAGFFMYNSVNGGWSFSCVAEDFLSCKQAIPRPRKQIKDLGDVTDTNVGEWNGEGLPPVGMVCEYAHKKNDAWTKCKVNYVSNDKDSFIAADCHLSGGITDEQVLWSFEYKFRSIKTEAEKEREELLEVMKSDIEEHLTDNDIPHERDSQEVTDIAGFLIKKGWHK